MNKILLSGVVMLSACASARSKIDAQNVTVCSLSKAGAKMSGKTVRLKATYVSDMLEHSALVDNRCPNDGIAADWRSARDPNTHAFDEALFKVTPNYQEPVKFNLDVSGTFVWNTDERPRGTLIFHKVWKFDRLDAGANDKR